ncbi:MAG TPA: ABC transporter permease [Candidatus Limnocylindrales bacterium]|jgi:peptide/nickel transport system permease protein
MIPFLARRLAWTLLVLVAIGLITFLLTFVAPGDPARAIAGRNASAESVERIRHALGLDQSILAQLAGYVGRIAHGDFGHSFKKDADVLPYIVARLPATIQLAVGGLVVALVLGIPIGMHSARHPRGRVDRVGGLLTSALVAAPSFWVGYMLLFAFAFLPAARLGIELFPIGQYRPLDLRYLALPALTLGLGGAAYYARITRTAMLDELGLDYIRTARSQGFAERRIAWHHALRNAIPPILAQAGLDLGFFLGGVVVIEAVFSWPGIGKLAVDAVTAEDLPMLMGTVLFASLCVVLANLAVEVLIAFVDPRVRLDGSR